MALYGYDGDTVQDSSTGSAIEGCAVYIYETGTDTLATLYSGESGGGKSNPLTTDSNGVYSFYAAPGFYDHKFVHGSYSEEWDRNRQIVTVGTVPNAFRTITEDTTVDEDTDYILDCDCSSGAITVTMMAVADVNPGRQFGVRKQDTSANIVTVNDADSSEITTVEMQGEGVWIAHNGTTWVKVGVM